MAVKNPSDKFTFEELIERLKELYDESYPNPYEFERIVSMLQDKLNAKIGRTKRGG